MVTSVKWDKPLHFDKKVKDWKWERNLLGNSFEALEHRTPSPSRLQQPTTPTPCTVYVVKNGLFVGKRGRDGEGGKSHKDILLTSSLNYVPTENPPLSFFPFPLLEKRKSLWKRERIRVGQTRWSERRRGERKERRKMLPFPRNATGKKRRKRKNSIIKKPSLLHAT